MCAQHFVGEGALLRQPMPACDIPRRKCVMAPRGAKTVPSDPEYLLSLMSQIGEDSESDDDFDGWLDDNHRDNETATPHPPPCRHSMLLESLDAAHECSSPTHSPMQLSLSPTASPTCATLLKPHLCNSPRKPRPHNSPREPEPHPSHWQ